MNSINILLVGNSSVGKTSLCNRYAKGEFHSEFLSTIGTDIFGKSVRIDDENIYLKIMDFSGQERYRSIGQSYFRQADGIIFIFDITNKESLLDIENWLSAANNVNNDFKKILVGNKKDLEIIRVIDKNTGEKEANEKNMPYFETSAKTGENVEEIFIAIAKLIQTDKTSKNNINKNNTIKLGKNNEYNNRDNKKKNCCK